jgi:hypothetical protein
MRPVSSGSTGFAVLRREANEGGFFRPIVKDVVEMLRIFFKYKRGLLGDLCRCPLRSLTCYFEAVAGSVLTPGVIAAIQTFGDRINLHVHLHFLATEGGVDEAAVSPVLMNRKRFMSAGVFHKIPRIDTCGSPRSSPGRFRARFSHFLLSLTSPNGRKYITHVVKLGDSSVGAGIRGVTEKGNSARWP